jgi:hypothetical protein
MYITCWAPSMAVVSDLPLMDLAPREYGSQEGVAKILSTTTVAGRPDPLMHGDIRGPVDNIIKRAVEHTRLHIDCIISAYLQNRQYYQST